MTPEVYLEIIDETLVVTVETEEETAYARLPLSKLKQALAALRE